MRLLAHFFDRFVQNGELQVVDWHGQRHVFRGGKGGPAATIALSDSSLEWQLLTNPELYAVEAYMDGTLTLADGSTLDDLLTFYWHNNNALAAYPTQRVLRAIWMAMRTLHQQNSVNRAKQHARSHYDLPAEFYRLFLDDGLNYSCGYFRSPADRLETAQAAKHAHAIAKLAIAPGMRVLEIGGGWGQFAIELARAGARVVSLNVSAEQVALAVERAREAGVGDRIDFVVEDYREHQGAYDRVVSVGMMEHVGAAYLKAYFTAVREFLAPDGYAFVHSIGRMCQPGTTAPFLRKYVFPGGYTPALSETLAAIEKCDLWCADVEVLRLHYAYTIRHWRERFGANRDKVRELYDERFCRMWEFYLAAVQTSFTDGDQMVFQLLLSPSRDAVPINRDFMFDAERRMTSMDRRVDA